ncbi:hypothetical protein BKA65DRAFT_557440 [Rhexocercosporidium sp. MPI-PUGE-AT-0058]|nr:hypothetical protein BKA65DRAFT_557440 [Rhexocercosporidium sp. MPI-PUGE-AT-0058]
MAATLDQSPFSLTTFFSTWLVSAVFFCLILNTVSRSKYLLSKVLAGLLSAILFIIAGPVLWKAGVRVDQVAGFVLSSLALPFLGHRKCPYCGDDRCDGGCGQGSSPGSNDSWLACG